MLLKLSQGSHIGVISLLEFGMDCDVHFAFSESPAACARRIQTRAAEFLTFIKEDCTTTQRTVDNIVKGVDELFQLYNQYLKVTVWFIAY